MHTEASGEGLTSLVNNSVRLWILLFWRCPLLLIFFGSQMRRTPFLDCIRQTNCIPSPFIRRRKFALKQDETATPRARHPKSRTGIRPPNSGEIPEGMEPNGLMNSVVWKRNLRQQNTYITPSLYGKEHNAKWTRQLTTKPKLLRPKHP